MSKAQIGALGALGALLGIGAYGLLGAGTTPIGTASELSAWPQGRADAPLCIYGRVSDGGLTCVLLLGAQDGGDIDPNALWRDGGGGIIQPSGDVLTVVQSYNAQRVLGSASGSGFIQAQYIDGGGKSVGTYVDGTGVYLGSNTADDLQFYVNGGAGEAGVTLAGAHLWTDGGILFHDGTIQTTAAIGSPRYWDDAGLGDGSIRNLNLGPVLIGSTSTLSGGGALQITGSAASTAVDVTDGSTSFLINFNGSKVSLQSSPARQIDLAPNGTAFLRADPGTVTNRSFVPLDMVAHEIRALAAAAASDSAPQFQQTIAADQPDGTAAPQGLHAGSKTLSTGAGTVTFSPAFSTGTPFCVCTDSASVLSAKCSATSTTLTITVTGGGSDTVNWICVGTR